MKNKSVLILTIGFSLFFLIFVFRLTDSIKNSRKALAESPDVLDVTDLISTKLLVSKDNYPNEGMWTQAGFDASKWLDIKLPFSDLFNVHGYAEGNFAYYRIFIPKTAFDKLKHLQNETYLGLNYVQFIRTDITINGKFFRSNNPKNTEETILNIPVYEGQDNIISIKGLIGPGDTGIDNRQKILLGRGAELNELYVAGYKGMTVFPLVFILSKGSILFVFALIYLLLKVNRSFEEFLIFGLCTLLEEFIAGDYLFGPLSFNQMVYVYNFTNLIGAIALFLFFSDLVKNEVSDKKIKVATVILTVVSLAVAMDALYWNHFFNLTAFMKLWNLTMVCVMFYYLPRFFRVDRVFSVVITICISLYLWSALFSTNVGLNMKAYGNLLLFFMVAYQTLAIFRRDQELLVIQEKQLLEQEKDVAIGKTASLLAHDVRKPMELMKIVLDKISTGEFNKDFLDVAKKDMDFSIASVTSQVNDIMNYGRSSNVTLTDISFYKVLSGSIKQVMTIHHDLNIDLEYSFRSNQKIRGEESRLSSALVNLISNAVEAIKDIGGRTKGRIKFSTDISDNKFIVKIFNDGPAIPENVVNEIFKPLFTHGKAKGTGLGLSSVSKTLIEHNGTISVANVETGGVEFKLEFDLSPVADVVQKDEFLPSSKSYLYVVPKVGEKEKPALRIFLLDDDIQVFYYIEFLISKIPFNVELKFASDFESAIDFVKRSRFDLYLIDNDLRGQKSGLDFYQEYLHFLSSEVILLSNADRIDLNNLKCDLVNKPLSLDVLNQCCEKVNAIRPRVLLVDDTKLIRYAWQSFHGSHNIQTASSPEEALSILSNDLNHFDICVLDYHFENSEMNGEALARKIQKLKKDIKIFISSSVDQRLEDFKSISKRDYEVRTLLK